MRVLTRRSVTQLKCWTLLSPISQYSMKLTRMSVFDALRGYPETFLHCCNEIKQHPCGNETRGDRRERVC